jgi:ketosteroid isomerase-like protein
MKKAHFLLALMLAAAPIAYAQTADTKQKPATGGASEGTVEQTLMKIEHDTLAALLKKDAAAFGKFFSEDAVFTAPDGTVQTKAQLLADIKSGTLVIESSEMSDMTVHAHGDAAVVTYATNDKGKYKTQDISGRYRWTDVFVRRGGTWQIVAGHGTPIAEPKK